MRILLRVVLLGYFLLGGMSLVVGKKPESRVYEQNEVFMGIGEVSFEKGKVRVKAQERAILLKIPKGVRIMMIDQPGRTRWLE